MVELILCWSLLFLIYSVPGYICLYGWKEIFDDIKSRPIRVTCRFLMLIFWPAWLVFWAIAVAIAILVMGVAWLIR